MSDTAKIIALAKRFGGGIPETTEPHQHLVTDASGAAAWEDRTHYDSETVLYAESTYDPTVNNSHIVVLNGVGYTKSSRPTLHENSWLLLTVGEKQAYYEITGTTSNTFLDISHGIPAAIDIKRGSPGYKVTVTATTNQIAAGAIISITYGYPILKQLDEKFIPDTIARTADVPSIQTATVGQTIAVKAVDENGKPTEWEAVDAGGGSGGAGNLVITVKELDNSNSTINSANMTYAEIKAAIEAGTLENITVKFPEEDGILFASSVSVYVGDFGDGTPAINCLVTAHRYESPNVYYVHVFENNQIYAYEQD